MILRHLVVRHGRTVLTSSQCYRRACASEIIYLGRTCQQYTQDHKPDPSLPDNSSDLTSILDSSILPPTAATRRLAEDIAIAARGVQSVQSDLNTHLAAIQNGSISSQSSGPFNAALDATSFPDFKTYLTARKEHKIQSRIGSEMINVYNPYEIIENPPTPDAVTLSMLLANQAHLGHATALWHPGNSSYIFGIRQGIHIISLEVTQAYLRRAAKVVQEVARRGGIILFVGTRKGQQEIIINAAKLAEGYHIFDRWVPGSLTNGQQILGQCAVKVVNRQDQKIDKFDAIIANANPPVLKPDLVICMNPLENEVCLHECGLYNVPTIGIIDTDVNPAWVTYPIPANDDSLRSVALIGGALARAAQQGQEMRKEAASQGEMTFDTSRVQDYLENLEELAKMDVPVQAQRQKTADATA